MLCKDCNRQKADTLPSPDQLSETGMLVSFMRDGQLVYRPLSEVLPMLERRRRRR